MTEISSLIEDLKNFKNRSQARVKLSSLGPEQAGEQLLYLAKTEVESENAIWAAVTIFEGWRWKPAAEVLVEMLELRPNLQGDIIKALQSITGAKYGYDPHLWKIEVGGGSELDKVIALFSEEEAMTTEIVTSTEHGDYCVIKLAMSDGRKQKVSVMPLKEALQIYSESGLIEENQVQSVKNFAQKYPDIIINCEKKSNKYSVTLMRNYPREAIAYAELKKAIIELGEVADYAEKHLTEEDKI